METILRKYLDFLPKDFLKSHFSLPSQGLMSTTDYMRQVEKAILDEKRINKCLKEFSNLEKDILGLMLFCGDEGITLKQLQACCRDYEPEQVHEALCNLMKEIFVYGRSNDESEYSVFHEYKKHIETKFISIKKSIPFRAETLGDVISCGNMILGDLLSVCGMIFTGIVQRAQNFIMTKKSVSEISSRLCCLKFFSMQDRQILAQELIDLLFRFLENSGIIVWQENTACLTRMGEEWIKKKSEEQYSNWTGYLKKHYKWSVLSFHILSQFLADNENWVGFEWLLKRLGQDQYAYLDSRMPREIRFYFISGMLQFSVSGNEINDLRLPGTAYGNKESASGSLFRIMPSFEVILSDVFNFYSRFYIEAMADFKKNDAVPIYEINRESLYRGLDNGLDKREIVPRLESFCKNIPQNVIYCINEWLKEYDAVSFEKRLIIRIQEPCFFEKIENVLEKQPDLYKKIIPGYGIAIHDKDYDLVLDLIKRLGYFPRPILKLKQKFHKNGAAKGYEIILKKGRDKEIDFIMPPDKAGNFKNGPMPYDGKYGRDFKEVPFNEMVHVIKYAILVDAELLVEYKSEDGSEVYKIKPLELSKDWREPKLKAENITTGEDCFLLLDNIKRMKLEMDL